MLTFTCIFVCITLLLTALASLFLTLSLLSDEWEFISYDPDIVEKIAEARNHTVEWLPERLARIEREVITEINPNASQSIRKVFFLIPAHGGVNKLCADIPGKSISFYFIRLLYTSLCITRGNITFAVLSLL